MSNVSSVIALVRKVLRDADADQFSDDQIAAWILDAERAIAFYKPEATARDLNLTTVVGSRQTLDPATSLGLLDVRCNGTLTAPTRSIRLIAREMLDLIDPSWRSATPVDEATEYVFDDRHPTAFELNPPIKAGRSVVVLHVATPQPYSTPYSSASTMVNDNYEPALIDWTIYRCFCEDAEGSVNFSRSQRHLANFANLLGVKLQNDVRGSPRNPENKA